MTDRELLEQLCSHISECNAPKNAEYWRLSRESGEVKAKLTELMTDEQKVLFDSLEELMMNIRKQEEIRAFCITFQLAFNILKEGQ